MMTIPLPVTATQTYKEQDEAASDDEWRYRTLLIAIIVYHDSFATKHYKQAALLNSPVRPCVKN